MIRLLTPRHSSRITIKLGLGKTGKQSNRLVVRIRLALPLNKRSHVVVVVVAANSTSPSVQVLEITVALERILREG